MPDAGADPVLRAHSVTTDATGLVDVNPAPRSLPMPIDTSVDAFVDAFLDATRAVPRFLAELAPATCIPHQ